MKCSQCCFQFPFKVNLSIVMTEKSHYNSYRSSCCLARLDLDLKKNDLLFFGFLFAKIFYAICFDLILSPPPTHPRSLSTQLRISIFLSRKRKWKGNNKYKLKTISINKTCTSSSQTKSPYGEGEVNKRHKIPALMKKLFATNTWWERVFNNEWHWVY